MIAQTHDRRQPTAHIHLVEELTEALAPLGFDYAASIRLAATLPATDRRRCLQNVRGRYARLLRASLNATEWLVGAEAVR